MSVTISEEAVLTCCASKRFARRLALSGAHSGVDVLIEVARRVWWTELGVLDWLEAFAAHPRIGDATTKASAAFGAFSQTEQQMWQLTTTEDLAEELADLNRRYLDKFGFIFIICAKGCPAPLILAALKERYKQLPHEELKAAAEEQMKITELRLRTALEATTATTNPAASGIGLVAGALGWGPSSQEAVAAHLAPARTVSATSSSASPALRSPITTHVLDTATGLPAEGMLLHLLKQAAGARWDKLSEGITNSDGRVGNLLPPSKEVVPGVYRMLFHTGPYLARLRQQHPGLAGAEPFYPQVAVDFVILPDQAHVHYHVPLLLSPYGYSTYKGS